MKRWLLALVGLLGLTPGLALADYLVLIINLGKAQLHAAPAPGAGAGGPAGGIPPAVGGPRGGKRGGPGGQPGIGVPGGMGVQGGMAGGAGVNPNDVHLVTVCIEVDHTNPSLLPPAGVARLKQFDAGELFPVVTHKWGNVKLAHSTGPVIAAQFYRDKDGKIFPRAAKRFEAEEKNIGRLPPSLANKLEIAEKALSLGLAKKFEDEMAGLAKTDLKDPTVAAYLKIKGELDKPVTKMPADSWYRKLLQQGYEEKLTSPHYVLLHKGLPPKGEDYNRAEAKLKHLEQNLRDYYCWWALHGLTLPVPREKLVAIVTSNADEFKYFHKGLSGGPIVFDGFHSAGPNVTVLALHPLEPKYTDLETFSRQYWSKPGAKTQAQALHSSIPPNTKTKEEALGEVEAGVMAIALKAMEEASETGSISHNASRQLLYASGLVPPHVAIPEWLLFGMSSIFETTPGTPWKTMGTANPFYLTHFLDLHGKRILESTGDQTIYQVVSDSYFRTAKGLPPDSPEVKKARATAWSLCSHLARREPAKLQAYFKELARMPRDLELDEGVLLGCFARAFDAWEPNRSVVDPQRLERLAQLWIGDMTAMPLDSKEMLQSVQRTVEEVKKSLLKPAG